jgi:hypothetical protein
LDIDRYKALANSFIPTGDVPRGDKGGCGVYKMAPKKHNDSELDESNETLGSDFFDRLRTEVALNVNGSIICYVSDILGFARLNHSHRSSLEDRLLTIPTLAPKLYLSLFAPSFMSIVLLQRLSNDDVLS